MKLKTLISSVCLCLLFLNWCFRTFGCWSCRAGTRLCCGQREYLTIPIWLVAKRRTWSGSLGLKVLYHRVCSACRYLGNQRLSSASAFRDDHLIHRFMEYNHFMRLIIVMEPQRISRVSFEASSSSLCWFSVWLFSLMTESHEVPSYSGASGTSRWIHWSI